MTWKLALRGRFAARLVLCAFAALAATSSLAPAAAMAHSRSRRRGCAHAHARIASTSRAGLQRAVVCLINSERRSHDLPALSESRRLNRAAQGWTNVMVRERSFSHGSNFAARISAVGFDWSTVGQNIATGYRTPAAVVKAWMRSPGHCQNILDPRWHDVGTGVDDRPIAGASSLPGTWTDDFGLWMGRHAPSDNWRPADGCPYG
ncbi:MAG: CAP domain-containing protein [Solirubrobacteraceae bacterium]